MIPGRSVISYRHFGALGKVRRRQDVTPCLIQMPSVLSTWCLGEKWWERIIAQVARSECSLYEANATLYWTYIMLYYVQVVIRFVVCRILSRIHVLSYPHPFLVWTICRGVLVHIFVCSCRDNLCGSVVCLFLINFICFLFIQNFLLGNERVQWW